MQILKRRLMIFVFVVGLSALAGCACLPGTPQLIIYHAGSLTAGFTAVETLFTQQTGVCVIDVAAGSVDAARRITAGQEPCDIFASADFKDIDLLLKPAGFADYDILFGQAEWSWPTPRTARTQQPLLQRAPLSILRIPSRRLPTTGTRSLCSQGLRLAVPTLFSIRAAIAPT